VKLKERIDQLEKERKAIERMLYLFDYGLTSAQIAGRTGYSLRTVREHLQTMKGFKHVKWFAKWYGRNRGYTKKYQLTDRGKEEAKEY